MQLEPEFVVMELLCLFLKRFLGFQNLLVGCLLRLNDLLVDLILVIANVIQRSLQISHVSYQLRNRFEQVVRGGGQWALLALQPFS
jgi:hypothetical protein